MKRNLRSSLFCLSHSQQHTSSQPFSSLLSEQSLIVRRKVMLMESNYRETLARHQECLTPYPRVFNESFLKRQILNSVSHKGKPQLAEELSDLFALENKEMKSLLGYEQFITFVTKWEKKYPILKKYKAERNIAYFTYMDFPVQVQRYIYTTNWIERLNRKYKRTMKMRTSMPSNKSVLFLLASVAMEETKNICQENLSMEILEIKERKMNKNKEGRTYTLFRTLPRLLPNPFPSLSPM